MKLADVSPAIIEQISQEPEEAYWFVWSRVTDNLDDDARGPM